MVSLDAIHRWWREREAPRRLGRELAVVAIGVAASMAVLLPMALDDEFGSWYDVAAAREMPENREGGRSPYFDDEPLRFWLLGRDSGLVAVVHPSIALVGVVLPLLLLRPAAFPRTRELRGRVEVLALPLVAAILLFLAAHALFPRLYFPSRYPHLGLRLVLAPAAAIAVALIVDRLLRARPPVLWHRVSRGAALCAAGLLGVAFLVNPFRDPSYPIAAYHRGTAPALYRFLEQQPIDGVVASLSALADDVPAFARRTVLVSPHYAVPYHRGFYETFRERTLDLIAAQYTDDPERLAAVIRKHGVDYWLLDVGFAAPAYLEDTWLRPFRPAFDEARRFVEAGGKPVIARLERCVVLEGPGYSLLEAGCMLAAGGS
jgi:hypothetical protein